MKKQDIPEKACAYCENARLLIDGDSAVCKFKGAVSQGYSCRRFVFDPLKLNCEPKRIKLHTEMEALF